MKPTLLNRSKLFFHLLLNFHRRESFSCGRFRFWLPEKYIGCADCKYGNEDRDKMIKELGLTEVLNGQK